MCRSACEASTQATSTLIKHLDCATCRKCSVSVNGLSCSFAHTGNALIPTINPHPTGHPPTTCRPAHGARPPWRPACVTINPKPSRWDTHPPLASARVARVRLGVLRVLPPLQPRLLGAIQEPGGARPARQQRLRHPTIQRSGPAALTLAFSLSHAGATQPHGLGFF